ncbi:hypothetical protein GCM10009111_05320 [Colwellia asteriadis]|uniref:OmpA-like domain-containing protein n=1 Tax=Colwellia asteriadis TaxID=517723 RepID=A0ABN1L3G1_9GAMM
MASVRSVLTHTIFKVILSLYLSLYFLIWAISSPVTKHYLEPVLHEYGLALSQDSSIRYNPFMTELHISDFTLTTQASQEKVFSIGSLTLQLRLWEVLFDDVLIEEFTLNDSYIKIVHNQGKLTIAGVELPESKPATDPNPPVEPVETSEPTAPLPYQIILPEFLISQFHLDIINNDIPHEITINDFALRDVKATEKHQQGQLFINALLDTTALQLKVDANLDNALGDINSEITLDNYPIERLLRYAPQLNELSGVLSLNAKQKLTLQASGIALHIEQANIANNNLIVVLPEQRVSLDNVQHSITDLMLTINNGEIAQLDGTGSIAFNHFTVRKTADTVKHQQVFSAEKLAIDNIIYHREEHPSIKIADIIFDNLVFSTTNETSELVNNEKLPPIVKLKQLVIDDINLNERRLSIDTITLDSLLSHVIINKEKELINLVNLASSEQVDEVAHAIEAPNENTLEEETIATPSPEEKAQPNFIFSLNKFQLVNTNEIFFIDHSVDPHYNSDFFIDTLTLEHLSNDQEKQSQPSPFVFKGRNNKYTNFNLTGFIQPFATTPIYKIAGDFKELSLPTISSYLKDSTGLEVKTGQLNINLDVLLTGDILEGDTTLLLQGLETAIVDDDEVDSILAQGALPLNIAMGMLKDGDGNVELGLPLSGSTDDPKFGVSSIVTLITQKAIISATQDYLVKTFVPYANIVSLAMTAGEFALKLRFDDLPYSATQIAPGEEQQVYLTQFIELMQKKKSTRVNLCAVTTPADIGLPNGEKVTDKGNKKRLTALGNERASALKDYLIEQGNIESARLLLCTPKIDSSAEALPRIAISV